MATPTRTRTPLPALPTTSVYLTAHDWQTYSAGGARDQFLRQWRAHLRPTGLRFIDFFCGCGGEAQGLVAAGLTPILGANHWSVALHSHAANHPDADHFEGDLHEDGTIESLPYAEIFWASPECPAWSQANGEPRTFAEQPSLFSELAEEERELYGEKTTTAARERSRALMWDVPRYLEAMQIREGRPVLAGVVENVIDCRKWVRWDEWVAAFHKLGYRTRLVALNSMHAIARVSRRAPQSRDRLYFLYWHESLGCDPDFDKWLRPRAQCGEHGWVDALQSWKRPGQDMGRYGRYGQYTYRCPRVECRNAPIEPPAAASATILDWTLRTERIGDRRKPLVPNTRARIAAALVKYRRAAFLATTAGHTFERSPGVRTRPLTAPLPTQHTTAAESLCLPAGLAPSGAGDEGQPVPEWGLTSDPASWAAATEVLAPNAAGTHHALVMRNNTGGAEMSTPAGEPLRTLTTAGHQSLLQWREQHAAVYAYDAAVLHPIDGPLPAQTTIAGDALLGQPLAQLTAAALAAEAASVTDDEVDACTLRMLVPAEVGLGMAFGPDYVVLGKGAEKMRQYGNAVTPPVAELFGLALREVVNHEQLDRYDPAAAVN